MKFIVLYKKEFGKDRFYPRCDDSRLVLGMMGRESFTKDQVESMVKHGWSVDIEYERFDFV